MKYQENAGVFRYEEFCRALDNLDWIVIRSAMRNETSAQEVFEKTDIFVLNKIALLAMQKITEDHSLTADLLHILINMTYFSANTSITLIEHKAISKINKVFDKHPNDCA